MRQDAADTFSAMEAKIQKCQVTMDTVESVASSAIKDMGRQSQERESSDWSWAEDYPSQQDFMDL